MSVIVGRWLVFTLIMLIPPFTPIGVISFMLGVCALMLLTIGMGLVYAWRGFNIRNW